MITTAVKNKIQKGLSYPIGAELISKDHEYVVGINNVSLKTDAPMAEVSKLGRGKKTRYRLNISSPAVPGPGPVYFDEKFETVEDLVTAVRECYFSDRIDFNNPSLDGW